MILRPRNLNRDVTLFLRGPILNRVACAQGNEHGVVLFVATERPMGCPFKHCHTCEVLRPAEIVEVAENILQPDKLQETPIPWA
jgi:hypothetical protein